MIFEWRDSGVKRPWNLSVIFPGMVRGNKRPWINPKSGRDSGVKRPVGNIPGSLYNIYASNL